MAAVSGLQQWEELRRRALRLETEVDSKLIAYNKVITEVSLKYCPWPCAHSRVSVLSPSSVQTYCFCSHYFAI